MHEFFVKEDDLADGAVAALLNAHLLEMQKYSPAESIHALTASKLKRPGLCFWSVWHEDEIAGCGALQQLSPCTGEIKSMKTADAFLRRGVAELILDRILLCAQARSYSHVYLETGSHSAFLPAVSLYQKYDFVECSAFSDYTQDPYSRYFVRSF